MKTKEIGIQNQSEVYFLSPSNLALNTFLYVTCAGHFFYEDDYHLWRQSYNSYLCLYLQKGRAKITAGSRTFLAKAGDLVYLDCYQSHGYDAISDLETVWFHYDGVGASQLNQAIKDLDTTVFSLSDNTRAVHYIRKIVETCGRASQVHEANGGKPEQIREPVISAYIMSVLSELFPSSQIGSSRQRPEQLGLIEETMDYVQQHLDSELSIQVLADQASLSKYYFARTFKKETGYTPHEYVLKARINHAKVMLRGTELVLRQIAMECGFPDESSLVTAFKKNTGMTPGAFRSLKL